VVMELRKQRSLIEEARQMDIVHYLSKCSNRTIAKFLLQLNGNLSFHQPLTPSFAKQAYSNTESKINIVNERALSSFSLLRYLKQRRIPIDLAEQFCREVKYEVNGKEYFAIGFKNNSGGYELRNPYYKFSSSPKDITTFNNQGKEAAVFEGFFNFLSFMAMQKNQEKIESNFVILNSASFFEKARPFMEQHEAIRLYLDRDKTGQSYSQYASSLSKKYKDESGLYKHHNDLNDWLINFGKAQRKNLGHTSFKIILPQLIKQLYFNALLQILKISHI